MDWLTVKKDLVAGSISGASGIIVGHPLDVIKVRQQATVERAGMVRILIDTVRQEGFFALGKGILPPVLSQGAYTALAFTGFNSVLGVLTQEREATIQDSFIAGCAGGALTTLVTTPCDVIKINLQLDHSRVGFGGVRRLVQDRMRAEGLRGMYGGWVSTFWRDMPSSGLYFVMYYEGKDFLLEKTGNNLAAELLSGGFAGVLSWGSVIPIDVVKTRMQMDVCSPPHQRLYASNMDCVRQTLAKEGISGFFKGSLPVIARAFPVNAVTFFTYERIISMYD